MFDRTFYASLVLAALVIAPNVYAGGDNGAGNGGNACEMAFKRIALQTSHYIAQHAEKFPEVDTAALEAKVLDLVPMQAAGEVRDICGNHRQAINLKSLNRIYFEASTCEQIANRPNSVVDFVGHEILGLIDLERTNCDNFDQKYPISLRLADHAFEVLQLPVTESLAFTPSPAFQAIQLYCEEDRRNSNGWIGQPNDHHGYKVFVTIDFSQPGKRIVSESIVNFEKDTNLFRKDDHLLYGDTVAQQVGKTELEWSETSAGFSGNEFEQKHYTSAGWMTPRMRFESTLQKNLLTYEIPGKKNNSTYVLSTVIDPNFRELQRLNPHTVFGNPLSSVSAIGTLQVYQIRPQTLTAKLAQTWENLLSKQDQQIESERVLKKKSVPVTCEVSKVTWTDPDTSPSPKHSRTLRIAKVLDPLTVDEILELKTILQ